MICTEVDRLVPSSVTQTSNESMLLYQTGDNGLSVVNCTIRMKTSQRPMTSARALRCSGVSSADRENECLVEHRVGTGQRILYLRLFKLLRDTSAE